MSVFSALFNEASEGKTKFSLVCDLLAVFIIKRSAENRYVPRWCDDPDFVYISSAAYEKYLHAGNPLYINEDTNTYVRLQINLG